MSVDFKKLSQDIIKSIRSNRSKNSIDLSLGVEPGQMYRWEAGKAAVKWADFLSFCDVCLVNYSKVFEKILGYRGDPKDSAQIALFLIGTESPTRVAKLMGISRFTMHRLTRKNHHLTLVQMLKLISATSWSIADFIKQLVPKSESILDQLNFSLAEQQRGIHYRYPEVAALLRSLELQSYRDTPTHQVSVLAKSTGLTSKRIGFLLVMLHRAKIIDFYDSHYRVNAECARLYTKKNFKDFQRLLAYWGRKGCANLSSLKDLHHGSGNSYRVFSISAAGRKKLEQCITSFFHQVTAIIAEDNQTADQVLVLTTQLFNPGPGGRSKVSRNL